MTKLKILVVDDEEAMREVLRERLESFGFEVSTAADGANAERRLAAFDPDVAPFEPLGSVSREKTVGAAFIVESAWTNHRNSFDRRS